MYNMMRRSHVLRYSVSGSQSNTTKIRYRITLQLPLRVAVLVFVAISIRLLAFTSAAASAQQAGDSADSGNGAYTNTQKFIDKIGEALGNKVLSTAIDFAFKLLDVTGPSEVELAKREIISAIHAEQAQRIRGSIEGAMNLFEDVLSDQANMQNMGLLTSVMTLTDTAIGEIHSIINDKNADVAYQVAPALAAATSIAAAAHKLAGYPESRILARYQTMMDLGMDLVGVDFRYISLQFLAVYNFADTMTSDSKLLWQKVNVYGPDNPNFGHVCTSPAAIAEIPTDRGVPLYSAVRCHVRSRTCCFANSFTGKCYPVEPSRVPHAWEETHAAALRAFNNDDVVRTVKIAMLQAYAKGLNPSSLARPYIISRCLSASTRPLVDFDGDCKSDVAVWRSSEHAFFVRPSNGASPYAIGFPLDNATDIPVVGDFDGDRKTDVALWSFSDGNWRVQPSNGAQSFIQQWGVSGDIPVPGDYDGDGITDIAVWRPSEGTWWVRPSNGAQPFSQQWGVSGDIPVPGDYDGDGQTDLAVWRSSDGRWYILPSVTRGGYWIQGGNFFDIPVPADYDGDGRTDLAFFRPADMRRYVLPSNGGGAYWRFSTGISDVDIPVAGDYDGDGWADFIYWTKQFAAVWQGWLSGTGKQLSQQWGAQGDLPLGAN
jgi:hypothetical protein